MKKSVFCIHRFGSFFCEPIVAGLHPKTYESFISSMDSIGCMTAPEDFLGCGVAEANLCVLAENYWKKDMVFHLFIYTVLWLGHCFATYILSLKHIKSIR